MENLIHRKIKGFMGLIFSLFLWYFPSDSVMTRIPIEASYFINLSVLVLFMFGVLGIVFSIVYLLFPKHSVLKVSTISLLLCGIFYSSYYFEDRYQLTDFYRGTHHELVNIESVKMTSTYSNNVYFRAIDNRVDTRWTSEKGDVLGAKIYLTLSQEEIVSSIDIYDDRGERNNKSDSIVNTFFVTYYDASGRDISSEKVKVDFIDNLATLDIKPIVGVKSISLEVIDFVGKGNHFTVSEIKVWGAAR